MFHKRTCWNFVDIHHYCFAYIYRVGIRSLVFLMISSNLSSYSRWNFHHNKKHWHCRFPFLNIGSAFLPLPFHALICCHVIFSPVCPSASTPPSHFSMKVFHSLCPAVFAGFFFCLQLFLLFSFRWSLPDTSRLSCCYISRVLNKVW